FTITNVDTDVKSVEVFNGNVSLGFAEQIDGVWTFTASRSDSVGVAARALDTTDLNEGDNTLTVKVTDAAGNTSTSGELTVTLDTNLAQPVIDLNSGSDTGNSNEDNLTNDATATFTITNVDSDVKSVEVFNGDVSLGLAKQIDGVWTFTASPSDSVGVDLKSLSTAGLNEGENTLTVKVTDAAGNTSTSGELTVTLDTNLAQPVIDLSSGSDTGDSNEDNLTNDATATFTITNVDTDVKSVEVFNGNVSLGFAEQIDGVWTFTASRSDSVGVAARALDTTDLNEGDNTLTVKVTDAAGNTSTSGELTVTLDTNLAQPVIDLNSGSDTGNSNEDNLTNDATATFTITNVDSDVKSVEVFNGDVSLGLAKQIDGVWTFTA
ncbi:Ig-like domain-containing protein, partial [Marinomonas sp. BSi20584]|uniref:Ig-like domain-containing protein n=1 Tax=Marinomonas sp. BSi20584 TaxID=1594462 RepID=UPI000CC04D3B